MKFSAEDQNILITGDTGFVDFRDSATRKYYPALLKQLSPLHVVQVAHHAGRNAHFYNCLLRSAFPRQPVPARLLLSHRVNDAYPSTQRLSIELQKNQRAVQRDLMKLVELGYAIPDGFRRGVRKFWLPLKPN